MLTVRTTVDIIIQYFDSCQNWSIVESRVKALIDEHGIDATLHYQLVDTPEAAEEHHFAGSPTLLIDGRDPFATGRTPIGLACRTYMTDSGPAGSPSLEQLRSALVGS